VLVDELPHLQSHGWNPLLQLDPTSEDFESDAYCIAEAITDSAGANDSSSGRFFAAESSLNLAACLVIWERYVHGDKASLCNVRATVCAPNEYADVDGEKRVVGGFLFELDVMRKCEHAAIRSVSTRLYQRLTDAASHGTSAQDVIDTFMSSTRFLDDPRIARDMKKGGRIDFAASHTEIVTIYIGLPPHQLVAQAKWLRLFINLGLAELYKHPPRNPTRNPTLPPVLFMLDEFGNVGRLSNIVSAMNIARDYGVQLWMFLQNLGQLKANNYPKEWTSFFSGSGVLTTFNASDTETQQELSKLFGHEEKSVPTETAHGISTGLQAIPIVRPEDISRLGRRGETINLIEPCTMPIRGIAPVYAELPSLADGLDLNPYWRG
jgi:type IV secretion system protein VirD4